MDLETEVLFRRHWQLACHQNDLPDPGNYVTFDMCGERAVILRGDDGVVRAFHNVCRHRGSRVAVKTKGQCRSALVCPFHGWSYNLDGTLRSPARPASLPKLDPVEFGLKPVECEIWHGFVFVRFKQSDQPSVKEIMAPFEAEAALYNAADMVPAYRGYWKSETAVNWKAVRDVDNEGYHVPMAHPGLQDLYGHGYFDEALSGGANRSFGPFNAGPGRTWSVRNYKKIVPDMPNLPESHKQAWVYLGMFPNTVIAFYPESMMFYQEFPVHAGLTLQRGATYRYKDETRQMRLARYLSTRIDRSTLKEDVQLTIWSCEAAKSSGFDGIMLSDLEYGVRSFHDRLRELLPVMGRAKEPAPGSLERINSELAMDHVA
ncbi:MAG TPA: aromatic ring-hydroxylating dioxygenase subunit alpha [Kiloniellaceae bacterium]|nr:aromatic ring-hydroxylating dioxygenase subunit alpha [Kiloniellaceae bacterium]